MSSEKLGSFWVDTATVLIGDPCQLLPSANPDDTVPSTTRHQLIELFQGSRQEELVEIAGVVHIFHSAPGWKDHVVIPGGSLAVRVGTDGWCHVHLVRDARGAPRRIIIDIGKVAP